MTVPETNAREAAVVDGIKVSALKSLPQTAGLVNSPSRSSQMPSRFCASGAVLGILPFLTGAPGVGGPFWRKTRRLRFVGSPS